MGKLDNLYSQQKLLRKELRSLGNMMNGSLVRLGRLCGKPNCKCTRGERHKNLFLSYKVKQKPYLIYIPKRMEKRVTALVANHKRLKQIIHELSRVNRETIVLEKRSP